MLTASDRYSSIDPHRVFLFSSFGIHIVTFIITKYPPESDTIVHARETTWPGELAALPHITRQELIACLLFLELLNRFEAS
jgi:hypothetical protein